MFLSADIKQCRRFFLYYASATTSSVFLRNSEQVRSSFSSEIAKIFARFYWAFSHLSILVDLRRILPTSQDNSQRNMRRGFALTGLSMIPRRVLSHRFVNISDHSSSNGDDEQSREALVRRDAAIRSSLFTTNSDSPQWLLYSMSQCHVVVKCWSSPTFS